MFKVSWDRETGGVRLGSLIGKDTVNISPRPVFYEELNLLGLHIINQYFILLVKKETITNTIVCHGNNLKQLEF